MVADLSSTTTTPKSKVLSPVPAKSKRLPLASDNNGRSLQRRPKSKDVSSRYLSYTASSKLITDTKSYTNSVCTPTKKFPLPVVPVTSPSSVSNRRDHSVDRRHSRTVEMSASVKMLTKTSARSLSVSFQGESFALPVSKVGKPAPERKKAPASPAKISENLKPIDKHRWPGRSRQGDFMTMSVDFTNQKVKLHGSETAGAVRVLQKSMTTETKLEHNKLEALRESDNSDHTDSDPESISSGSTVGNVRGGGPRAIVVPARFWQETINLLRRVQPVPVSPPPLLKKNKPMSGCKVIHDGLKLPPRGSSFSPPSPMSNNLENTASILSFCADSKRGKVGEKQVLDAHVLRLLHNKHMQWRLANAKVDAAMVVQRAAAQKTLYNAWVSVSKLWQSIISKRQKMQQLKHNLKLYTLLKKQMLYLDNWDLADTDHSISLAGAIGALESSSICLPVFCGAKIDIENLKDAICSAVDVMQTMSVSLCSLLTKVENVNSMAFELANAMKTECSLLDQCKDWLSTLTLLEKQDCSLRAHSLQLLPAATMTKQPKMMPF